MKPIHPSEPLKTVNPDEFIAAIEAFQRTLPGKPLTRAQTDRAKKTGRAE